MVADRNPRALPEVADAARVAIDPFWKDLRDDPRFKTIIAKHRPKD